MLLHTYLALGFLNLLGLQLSRGGWSAGHGLLCNLCIH